MFSEAQNIPKNQQKLLQKNVLFDLVIKLYFAIFSRRYYDKSAQTDVPKNIACEIDLGNSVQELE